NNVKKQLAHIAKTLQLTSKKWEILKQKHKSDNSFKELDKKFKQLHNSLIELCNFLSAGDIKSAIKQPTQKIQDYPKEQYQ
ncbi:Tar ligand binding domain-containing protein, partial [Salmonella enterica subsp. enterica serovar Kentucky]|nr:Tar ligand binding domain-containing protein [Salmonella enterica subsp. enterica serovar Kentucky]